MIEKIEGKRRKGWQGVRWLDSTSMDMNLSALLVLVENRGAWHAIVHVVTESDMTQQLNKNKANRVGNVGTLINDAGITE